MRIWSIHPKYLDSYGIMACWRETLLAKNVLLGLTKGYKNHPQLLRFKKTKYPIKYIDNYLNEIYLESIKRGYKFSKNKIGVVDYNIDKINITNGQIQYEFNHLLSKLKHRDYKKYIEIKDSKNIKCNPIFKIVPGYVESWEKTQKMV